MKITLITVSYDSEKTIRETLDSVRSQRRKGFDLEYIHIDGLSTDSTMLISQVFDDIVSMRVSEKDSGIYNAMNKGIDMATGDVIGFLNSDDTYASNDVLHSIASLFNSDEDLDIVYGDINYVDSSGQIKRKWRTGQSTGFSKGWHPAHPGFYAKKSIFDAYGNFDEALTIAADFDLMLRFFEIAETNTKYLDKVFVNMKLGGESNRSFKNIWLSNKQIIQSFKKYSIKPRFGYTQLRWFKKILQSYK
jgi:glycosyltransferase involved in cell wall biosynthesis